MYEQSKSNQSAFCTGFKSDLPTPTGPVDGKQHDTIFLETDSVQWAQTYSTSYPTGRTEPWTSCSYLRNRSNKMKSSSEARCPPPNPCLSKTAPLNKQPNYNLDEHATPLVQKTVYFVLLWMLLKPYKVTKIHITSPPGHSVIPF